MRIDTGYLGCIQPFAPKLKILLGSSFEISMILLEATFYSLAQANIPDCAQIFIRDSGYVQDEPKYFLDRARSSVETY